MPNFPLLRSAVLRLVGVLLIAAGASARAADAVLPDVVELSANDAALGMAEGRFSAESLTRAYLARIAALDDAGPKLGAVIELNPRALQDAIALDAERRAGRVRGALHGVPLLIKDNIDVAGLVNSAGSLALADNRPAHDAFVVQRLRAAGVVVLGKTNLSEWANFRSTRSISGWSSRGGQTRNPYALDRSACGSSSGTASALAASLAALGVGTETDGSILCPAAVTGLVGLKPTVGLVSRAGIIPISASQDTAGPMTRSVVDAAMLLNGMVGVDPQDPAGAAAQGRIAPEYRAFLGLDTLRGRRFGLLRQAMGFHPQVDALVERAVGVMRARGAEVIDVSVADYGAWSEAESTLMLHEFRQGLESYLRASGSPLQSLAALMDWNRAHADRVMPWFGQELFEQAQAIGAPGDAAYVRARKEARRLAREQGIVGTLVVQRLDALIAPSTGPAWLIDPLLGDYSEGAGYGMAAVAGTPSLTVPIGDIHGLPVGLSFMNLEFGEGLLLGYGFALEQALQARRPPDYRATVGNLY